MADVPPGPQGPGGAPSDNPGVVADAMSKVRTAVDMLQQSLPGIPIGSDAHKEVLSAITKLSKAVPPTEAIPGIQTTQLAGLQQQASQDQMLQQLAAAMGQGPATQPVQSSMGA